MSNIPRVVTHRYCGLRAMRRKSPLSCKRKCLLLCSIMAMFPLVVPRRATLNCHQTDKLCCLTKPRVAGVSFLYQLSPQRSEEHTSELQSRENLVCRLLLEKKKNCQWISYVSGAREQLIR